MNIKPIKAILFSLVVSAFTFTSCSDDDSNSSANLYQISPPEWVQGTWIKTSTANSDYKHYMKFTHDNVYYEYSGNENDYDELLSFKGAFNVMKNYRNDTNYKFYEVVKTANSYQAEEMWDNIIHTSIRVTKLDNNKILINSVYNDEDGEYNNETEEFIRQ